jgi:hypothetical protein
MPPHPMMNRTAVSTSFMICSLSADGPLFYSFIIIALNIPDLWILAANNCNLISFSIYTVIIKVTVVFVNRFFHCFCAGFLFHNLPLTRPYLLTAGFNQNTIAEKFSQ